MDNNNSNSSNNNTIKLFTKLNFILFTFSKIKTEMKGDEEKKILKLPKNWNEINESKLDQKPSTAIITGVKNGLTVIDIDDDTIYDKLVVKYPFLKNNLTIKTYKGYHIYFKYNSKLKNGSNCFKNYPKIDIRNDGGFVIAPPTKYILLNGDIGSYKICISKQELFDIKDEFLLEIDDKYLINNNETSKRDEIIELLKHISPDINYEKWVNVGMILKNELGSEGFDIYNNWSSQGAKYDGRDKLFNKYNSFEFDGLLSISTLYKMKKECYQPIKQISKPIHLNTPTNSDKYNILINFNTGNVATYFKTNFRNKFIYSNEKLYSFNGVYWVEDTNSTELNIFVDEVLFEELLTLYQEYERQLMKDGTNYKDNLKTLQKIQKDIYSLKNFKIRDGYISDIKCKITDNKIEWNKNPFYFQFDNTLYDIQQNKFIESRPEYFINMSAGYNFDDNDIDNRVNELDNFINTIHSNTDIKTLYLQILSSGLMGETVEKFIVANGKGGNGKGVINELMLKTVGNYGYVLPSNLLLGPLKTGSNPELANCNDKRFVLVREPDSKFKFNCATLKELTGGDEINARLNHSNDTKTKLKLTLIIECNDKPKLSEVNDAIDRRLIDIPFNSIFIDKSKFDTLDKEEIEENNYFISNSYYKTNEFKEKFKCALFVLLTRHFKEYLTNNKSFNIPTIIKERNNNYLLNSDEIYNILDEILIKTNDKKDIIKLKELFEIFKASEFYSNLSKVEKKTFNYKGFQSKLESNIFFRKSLKEDNKNVKILVGYKMKDDEEEHHSISPYDV